VPIERIRAGGQVRTVDLDEGKLRISGASKTFKSGRNAIIELGLGDQENTVGTDEHAGPAVPRSFRTGEIRGR